MAANTRSTTPVMGIAYGSTHPTSRVIVVAVAVAVAVASDFDVDLHRAVKLAEHRRAWRPQRRPCLSEASLGERFW